MNEKYIKLAIILILLISVSLLLVMVIMEIKDNKSNDGLENEINNKGGINAAKGEDKMYKDISAKEVNEIINDSNMSSNHKLIDVREPSEYNEGHIPGAINIPLSEIKDKKSNFDKDKKLIFICASGGRSLKASKEVSKDKDFDVYNMVGGMNGWTYDIEKNSK